MHTSMAYRNKLIVIVLAVAFTACEEREGLGFEDFWVQPTTGDITAAYITIKNPGQISDTLLEVRCEVAGVASIHETRHEQGMMRMRPLENLPIPARSQVVMQPGGFHIMLEGLDHALQAGEVVNLRLRFENMGEITLPVTVEDRRGHEH